MHTDYSNPFTGTQASRSNAIKTLLFAAVVTIALYWVPYAGYVTYPIRLLVTFIHEGAHALMGIFTGGSVASISIQPDGSGLTVTRLYGWLPQLLVASAGYLGASLYGAGLIGLLRRGMEGRKLLFGTGVAVGLVTLGVLGGLIHTGNGFGLMWGILLTGALMLAGLKLNRETAGWVASFIGVQCVLNALFDLKTLFTLTVSTLGGNDAANMARLTLIPAPVWAVLWIGLSLGMLWFVLRPARTPALASRLGR
jgi:hypothetical protein